MKECPLCGTTMRLRVSQASDALPGRGLSGPRIAREWVCPECDYFEEAETGEE